MISQFARGGAERVLHPLGSRLARMGVSPNAITVFGATGMVVSSVVFLSQGHLLVAIIVLTFFALTDLLDGAVARAANRPSKWGALLDSVADRISDGALFGALAYWLATENRFSAMAAALLCLVTGMVVSYIKARAEGLGAECTGGFAERLERLLVVGAGGIVLLLGWPVGLDVALWVLVALGIVTIVQRMHQSYRRLILSGG